MNSKASTPAEYLDALPAEKRIPMEKLRQTILNNLPAGFEETMGYGMLGYVVPHQLYPAGYHCNPKLPLPFINLAAQKNFIAFYHMGIYAMPELLQWFQNAYPQHTKGKLDMGKSCIRFKKPDQIPYELLGELVRKISVKQWIATYEKAFLKGSTA